MISYQVRSLYPRCIINLGHMLEFSTVIILDGVRLELRSETSLVAYGSKVTTEGAGKRKNYHNQEVNGTKDVEGNPGSHIAYFEGP